MIYHSTIYSTILYIKIKRRQRLLVPSYVIIVFIAMQWSVIAFKYNGIKTFMEFIALFTVVFGKL